MSKRVAHVSLVILVLVVISFASFKYGELQSRRAHSERDLDEKLAAAFAIQSVKLLLKAEEGMSTGKLQESRETLITHLGDSIYLVGKGLKRNDRAYMDIAASLCPRRQQISEIITRLPEEKSANEIYARANQRARKKLLVEGLGEIEKHCAAARKQ